MFTVFLAFVIFAKLDDTAPKVIEGYKTLEDCWVAASNKNRPVVGERPKAGTGYVCLQMRGDV